MRRAEKQPQTVIPQLTPIPKIELAIESSDGNFSHIHTIVHLSREHRERKPTKTSQQGVSGNGRSGEHQIRVDDVVHQLQEHGVDSEAEEKASKSRYDPWNVGIVASPTEPEKADSKRDSSNHWPEETPFRHRNVVVCLQFLDVARIGGRDGGKTNHYTNDHTDVWKTRYSRAHAVDLSKNDAVRCKRQIQHTVDEGHLRRVDVSCICREGRIRLLWLT